MLDPAHKATRGFILANTGLQAPPHVPEINLYLADEAHDLWHKTEEELATIGLPPPFWAFAWAGGQGVARYILDHPEMVFGKTVLDFASGSGLVAIAAMKAGADVFYEKPLADRLIPWFAKLAARGAHIIVGDPGRAYLPKDRLEQLAVYTVPVTRALEDAEVKRTTVWGFI